MYFVMGEERAGRILILYRRDLAAMYTYNVHSSLGKLA